MLNYIDPSYNIVKQQNENAYKVEVTALLCDIALSHEVKEAMRREVLQAEAAKDPLFAIAFIQFLAEKGDAQAQEIAILYRAYCTFLEENHKEQFRTTCHQLMQKKNLNPVVHDFLQCMEVYFTRSNRPTKLDNTHHLLNQLLPNVEKTIKTAHPRKLYTEQEVLFPEIDHAAHKGFPDFIKYGNEYYLCFREARSHVGYEDFGKIRILKGIYEPETKRWSWKTVGLLSSTEYDLRDPRFFNDDKNSLHMIMGGSKINENDETTWMTPHIAILEKGNWHLMEASCDPSANGLHGQWIWRVTWNPLDGHGYAFSYGKETALCLMRTADGTSYKKIAEIAEDSLPNSLTEATLCFKTEGSAIALIRGKKKGVIALSNPDKGYTEWFTTLIPFRLGGPNFLVVKEGKEMWATTRYFLLHSDNTLDSATILGWMDEKRLVPVIRLKSQGDNSYPGMVLEEDQSLTIVYYSGEAENVSKIYITRLEV
jgi:hypothetical protein